MKKHIRFPKSEMSLKKAREIAIKKFAQVRDAKHAHGCWRFVVI